MHCYICKYGTYNSSDPTIILNNPIYAPNDSLASLNLGWIDPGSPTGSNGISLTYTYNNRLQPVNMTASNTTVTPNTTLFNQTYSFVQSGGVNNGTVTSITNNLATGRSQSYTYDEINRLATAQSQATSGTDCWGQSFTYDRYANLTGISVTQCSAPALSLNVNTANNQVSGYTYDAAGEVTNDGTNTYTWNAEGRMVTAAGWTYTYDGNGRRVMKSDGAGHGTMYWYGPSGEVLAETDLSGNITSEYVYFNGARIARRDPSTGNIYYYLNDRLGSAKMIVATTSSGSITGVAAESDYYPYGGERVVTADSSGNNYKFTGHERDSESGLDHTENRQYASTTGRWLSPDRVHGMAKLPQSWNRYAYVGGNPLNRLDPDGKYWVCIEYNYDDYGDGGDCVDWEWEDPADYINWIVEPNQQAKDERKKRKKKIEDDAAAIYSNLKKNNPSQLDLQRPGEIQETAMCSTTGSNGGFELDVTYQILDQNGRPMNSLTSLAGFAITESFPWQNGNLGLTPGDPWSLANGSISPSGTFVDHLNSGGLPGFPRQGMALQEFTASGWFGSQALDIIFGGSSVNGVNKNYYTPGGVMVNDQTSLTSCGR